MNIRALLAQRAWTAPELARRAGISPKTLNNLLNGRHAPQLDVLQKIAHAFDLELWMLFWPQLRQVLKLVRASGARGAGGRLENFPDSTAGIAADATTQTANPAPHLPMAMLPNDHHPGSRCSCRECLQRFPKPSNDYCGADGGAHEWVASYWIGGERDENGEHTICRKCHEEYVC